MIRPYAAALIDDGRGPVCDYQLRLARPRGMRPESLAQIGCRYPESGVLLSCQAACRAVLRINSST